MMIDLNAPYPLDRTLGSRVLLAFIYGFCVFIFIFVFEPFGIAGLPVKILVRIGVKYGLITFTVVFFNNFIKNFFSQFVKVWSLKYDLFFNAFTFLEIGAVNAIFTSFDIDSISFFELFWMLQVNTFKLGIFILGVQLLIERNIYLNQRVRVFSDKPNMDTDSILLKDLRGNHAKVLKNDIVLITSDDHYQKIYTTDSYYYVRGTLKAFEVKLESETFMRIHRSTLINLNHISKYATHGNGEYILIMHNGEKVKVSRSYRTKFKSYLQRR